MHTDFITSDIFEIVDDAIMSTSTIGQNIAHYPLCEYLLQSVFLRLTGYQEQKLKCILSFSLENEITISSYSFSIARILLPLTITKCGNLFSKT